MARRRTPPAGLLAITLLVSPVLAVLACQGAIAGTFAPDAAPQALARVDLATTVPASPSARPHRAHPRRVTCERARQRALVTAEPGTVVFSACGGLTWFDLAPAPTTQDA